MGESLRIASVGTGQIVDWFLEAAASIEGVSYVGTYSRSVERAREWGEPRGAHLFFDDLDALASSRDVDAVYVASPNALHMPQATQLLAAGKHVLAEKPLASNRCEAEAAFAIAHEKGVVFMEGMRSLHTPGFEGLRSALTQIGAICSATFRFSKVSSRTPALLAGTLTNVFNPKMAGGGLMDIGVYCVAPMVALWGRPNRVVAMGTTFDVSAVGGDARWPLVELAGEALCDYGSFVVNLSWGKMSDNHIPSQITGSKGTIVIDNANLLDAIRLIRPVEVEGGYGTGEGVEELLSFAGDTPLLAGELADFAQVCQGEGPESALARNYEKISLDELAVMDGIREELGVRFPADETA